MRLSSFILALFLLGTIFVPCTDDDSQVTDAGSYVYLDGPQSNNFDFDFCSPLCSCHCCHSHVVTSMLSFDFIDYKWQEGHSFYQTSLIDQAFPFWQPPKIS